MSPPPLPSRGCGLALLYFGLCLLLTVFTVVPVLAYGFGEPTSALALSFSAVGMSGGAVLIAEAWRRVAGWTAVETWPATVGRLGALGWIGAALGALSLGVVGEAIGTGWWNLLSNTFGWTLPTDALAAIADALLVGPLPARILFSVVVVLVGPLLEELVFRGFLWRLLGGGDRPVFALVFTSLLFAAWHLDPIQSVGVLPLAVFLGVLRWRTGSLWAPVVVHVANNGLALCTILLGAGDATSPALVGVACVVGTIAFGVIGRGSAIR